MGLFALVKWYETGNEKDIGSTTYFYRQ